MILGNYGQSNVYKLDNPRFKLRDFYSVYPQFGPINGQSTSDGNATDEQVISAANDVFNKNVSVISTIYFKLYLIF